MPGPSSCPVVPASDASVKGGKLEPEALNDTDRLELRVYGNEARAQAVLVARLDNLGKGASRGGRAEPAADAGLGGSGSERVGPHVLVDMARAEPRLARGPSRERGRQDSSRGARAPGALLPRPYDWVCTPRPSMPTFMVSPALRKHRRLHAEADAGGRAGGDDVARIELQELRDVGHEVLHAEDHGLRASRPARACR